MLKIETVFDLIRFSSTLDATSYVYPSEIFPTPVRAKGMAVSVAGLFLASIVILVPAPTAFANIQWRYFLVFVCASTIMAFVVYFMFPEVSNFVDLANILTKLSTQTNQKSLEDISMMFGDYVATGPNTEKYGLSIGQVEDAYPVHHETGKTAE
jgi:hypothetical protein